MHQPVRALILRSIIHNRLFLTTICLVPWLLLTLTIVNGDDDKDNEDWLTVELPMPETMTNLDMYRQRVGFENGLIASDQLPIIMPPTNSSEKLEFLVWYTDNPKSMGADAKSCPQKEPAEKDLLKRSIDRHLEYQKEINRIITKSDGDMAKFNQLLYQPGGVVRRMFLAFHCLDYLNWLRSKHSNATASTYKTDHYRLCPKPCATRDDNINLKDQDTTRYTRPCGYPPSYIIFKSRACMDSDDGVMVSPTSFTCKCFGKWTWNDETKICADLKSDRQINCLREGTANVRLVTYKIGNMQVQVRRCECKKAYYGSKCNYFVDPCTTTDTALLSGNVACNVIAGNQCVRRGVRGAYYCKCQPEYKPLIEQYNANESVVPLGPNCLVQADPCAGRHCVHGWCVIVDAAALDELLDKEPDPRNITQLAKRCLCQRGWEGETCNQSFTLRPWTSWTHWTLCYPSCSTEIFDSISVSFKKQPVNDASLFSTSTIVDPTNWRYSTSSRWLRSNWGARYRFRYRECSGDASQCVIERNPSARLPELIWNTNESEWRQFQYRMCRPRLCDRYLRFAYDPEVQAKVAYQSVLVRGGRMVLNRKYRFFRDYKAHVFVSESVKY